MEFINILLIATILFCSLVTGLVYTFGVIVMPGIQTLNDHDYLNAFKVMDGVIQRNHHLFTSVWLGSVLLLVTLCVVSVINYEIAQIWPTIVATILYILGVQVPTVTINVPINNHLQSLNLGALSAEELQQNRRKFETTWVTWNTRRTLISIMVVILLTYQAVQ